MSKQEWAKLKPFYVDQHNPGIVRGGWFYDVGGMLVGSLHAGDVAEALNAYREAALKEMPDENA